MILKPDHVRDVDLFVRWYGADAYGPLLFWRDDIPDTELEPVAPGTELPGGLRALEDGREMMETPFYLPEQRALVFADGLTAPDGELLVWATACHEERVLPRCARCCAAVRARAGVARRARARPGGLRGRAWRASPGRRSPGRTEVAMAAVQRRAGAG